MVIRQAEADSLCTYCSHIHHHSHSSQENSHSCHNPHSCRSLAVHHSHIPDCHSPGSSSCRIPGSNSGVGLRRKFTTGPSLLLKGHLGYACVFSKQRNTQIAQPLVILHTATIYMSTLRRVTNLCRTTLSDTLCQGKN